MKSATRLAELGFRLSLFAGAAVLVSMLLFGRRGALPDPPPGDRFDRLFGLLVVLDRAMRIPMAQLPFPVYSVAAISLMPLAHALVLTLLAPCAADRRHPAEGGHHHLIGASIAGAVTLVAGTPASHPGGAAAGGILAHEFIMPAGGAARTDCEPDPAGGLRAGHVAGLWAGASAGTRIDGAHDGGDR